MGNEHSEEAKGSGDRSSRDTDRRSRYEVNEASNERDRDSFNQRSSRIGLKT